MLFNNIKALRNVFCLLNFVGENPLLSRGKKQLILDDPLIPELGLYMKMAYREKNYRVYNICQKLKVTPIIYLFQIKICRQIQRVMIFLITKFYELVK